MKEDITNNESINEYIERIKSMLDETINENKIVFLKIYEHNQS